MINLRITAKPPRHELLVLAIKKPDITPASTGSKQKKPSGVHGYGVMIPAYHDTLVAINTLHTLHLP